MNINFTQALFILIIFQLLFLSFFLFTHGKEKRISKRLLGAFFLSIALNLLDVFLLISGVYSPFPALAGWGSCLPLLFGPFLYLYTCSVIYEDFSVRLKQWVHFIPFLIFFFLTEGYYLSRSRDVQTGILDSILSHHFHWSFAVSSSLIFIQFLLYVIFSLQLISEYKKAANQHFSNGKHVDVSWLYSTMIFFTLMMIAMTLNGFLARTAFAKYYLLALCLIILAMLVFINQVLLRALRNPYFFSMDDQNNSPDPAREKPIPSGRNQDELEEMLPIIIKYMQDEKPFLEPELTLQQLAARLSLKPKMLSLVINEKLGRNFFDFINHYRIEEAKRMLTNPEDKKITILEVLYEVGFNSKSSFNTLFKKYTGLTPSAFKQQQIL